MTHDPTSLTPDEARALLAQSDRDIARILGPRSGVAFVGSARMTPGLKLQMSRYGEVPTYIVNPKGGDAGEVPVVASVLDLPDEIDLVVIKVGPKATAQVWDNPAGLEWTVPSPAPHHTFDEPPVVK